MGKHVVKDENDCYLGSGRRLKLALKKYGIENFTREILLECESEQELNEAEQKIVTQELLDNPLCYNLALGGQGGNLGPNVYANRVIKWSDDAKVKRSDEMKLRWKTCSVFREKMENRIHCWKTMKEEMKEAQRERMKETITKKWQDPKHRKMISDLTRERMKNPPDSFKFATKGNKWIHFPADISQRKSVDPKSVPRYIALGWKLGMGPKKV